ncbi:MAG: amylo-alpha-1,6-glucosidase [Bryobacteraceae bacterium]|jgi:predicted glycogen debranching enzyme
MISFDKSVCASPEAGTEREWLETNGIGGFASSTVPGINTRRYHGLLTAALHPPVGRYVLLSKLEETVFLNGAKYDLSANRYAGATHPQGYAHLAAFRLDPFPIFTYEVGSVQIEKRVFMVHGENTTVVEYEVLGDAGSCTIEVRPLIAFRDYHSTTHANSGLDPAVEETEGSVSIQPYDGLPRLHFGHNATWVACEGNWYYNFEYARERERGLDYLEDLFQPLVMQFEIRPGVPAVVIASTETRDAAAAATLRRDEIARRAALRAAAPMDDPLVADLTAAADQFIVRRAGNLHTVIAGYHWFGDWGRDTMIALPGLTLTTGRFDIARDILLAFSLAADMGMLPNRFPDSGWIPEYNTVDASLWYFEAIRKYVEYTGDYGFVQENLYDTMKSIVDWHLLGTRFDIKSGPDGLISAGGPDTQLTWMDAKIGNFVATPRHGKPVEIQALWYNALRFTESLAHRFGDGEVERLIAGIAPRTCESFNALFWNEDAGCLYDVVNGDYRDPSIRPNQVIALSLGYTMVPPDRARSILAVVERDLLTSLGLRTLAPGDPQYRGHCEGGPVERDSSYHQGTVWPWLLGPFITAFVRTHQVEGTTDAAEEAGLWLAPFRDHLTVAGLGTISEILDGDAPHTPRGCIAQAWSVAEILRALVEDVYGITR